MLQEYRLQPLQEYHANDLRYKCHLLSEFITKTMETWEEPTNSMKRVDQVTKDLRQVGTTVDDEYKYVVVS